MPGSASTLATAVTLGVIAVACGNPTPVARIEDERIEASPELIAELAAGRAGRQARAALAMGRIQSPTYAEPLARAAGETNAEVRTAALFALGQLGLAGVAIPDAAVEAVRAALVADDPQVVAAAVEALGKLAPPGAAATLTPMLDHADARVRVEAAHALFRTRFVPTWRGDAAQPPELPAGAVAALGRALSDDDVDVRRAAAHAFSRYGQPDALAAVLASIGNDDEWVRLFCVRAVGRSGDAGALDPLTPALADASAQVRTEAVVAFDTLDGQDRLPVGLAQDPSFHVRAALARSLGGATTAGSLAALRGLEGDASPTVRAAAIDSLARRTGEDYRESLRAWLGDAAWTSRVAAAGALAHLGREGLELADVALGDADRRVRVAALQAIAPLDGVEDRLVSALESDDLAVRGTAVDLLADRDDPRRSEWLRAAYDSSAGVAWIEIREAIAAALERTGSGSDASTADDEALLRRIASTDPAPSVRARARRALAARGVEVDAAAAPPLEPSQFLGVAFATDPIVVLETSKGTMEIRCLASEAPIHVANFVKLVEDGYYDGLIWHRVVPNFVVQGGDPRGDGWGGPGYTIRDEINRTRFVRGTVGMPKAGKDTGGGQLFVTHLPTPHLDGNYTVFGQVVAGLDVIDRIDVGDRIERATVR